MTRLALTSTGQVAYTVWLLWADGWLTSQAGQSGVTGCYHAAETHVQFTGCALFLKPPYLIILDPVDHG